MTKFRVDKSLLSSTQSLWTLEREGKFRAGNAIRQSSHCFVNSFSSIDDLRSII